MSPQSLMSLLTWLVIVFSGLAAVFWAFAGFMWVNAATYDKPGPDGWTEAQWTDRGKDVVATARRQTFWNRFGALAACGAAACQALLTYNFPPKL